MADKYAQEARIVRKERQAERCRTKRAFPDDRSARRHNKGQRPYRCAFCGCWHLASYKVRAAMRLPCVSTPRRR